MDLTKLLYVLIYLLQQYIVTQQELVVAFARPSIVDIQTAPISNLTKLTSLNIGNKVSSLEFDAVEGRLYWATNDNLYSTTMDGKARENYEFKVAKIAIDSKHALLFYSSEVDNLIGVLSLYEFYHRTLLNDSTALPGDLTLDIDNRHIYWINKATSFIERCDYDGSSRQKILQKVGILGLVFYSPENKIFFGVENFVKSVTANGTDESSIWSGNETYKTSILKIYKDNLYVIQQSSNSSTLSSFHIKDRYISVLLQTTKKFSDISILNTDLEPVDEKYISDMNNCTSNFGDCFYFCLPLPGNKKTCLTPDGDVDPTDIDIQPIEPDPLPTLPPEDLPPPDQGGNVGAIVGDGEENVSTKPSSAIFVTVILVLMAILCEI